MHLVVKLSKIGLLKVYQFTCAGFLKRLQGLRFEIAKKNYYLVILLYKYNCCTAIIPALKCIGFMSPLVIAVLCFWVALLWRLFMIRLYCTDCSTDLLFLSTGFSALFHVHWVSTNPQYTSAHCDGRSESDPVVPVSLSRAFSPTLLELCFSNLMSHYWNWYTSLFRAKDYILAHSSQFIQSLHRDKPVRPILYYLHGLGHSRLFWWRGILCFLIAWIYFYTVLFLTTAWFLL